MASEKFEVRNRFTGAVQFTAEIECEPNTLPRIKLGLAVRWAYRGGAVLRDADLSDAVLRGAVLRDADLSDAVLRGADLRGADLRGAVLRGADLSDADLRGADLRGAVLRGADLRGAVLRGADLSDADPRGADLRGAVLRGEKINRILASVSRVCGGYTFNLFDMQSGPPKIAAGCRFLTIPQYREHVADDYPDTAKARETLRILDFFEATIAAEVAAVPTEAAACPPHPLTQ